MTLVLLEFNTSPSRLWILTYSDSLKKIFKKIEIEQDQKFIMHVDLISLYLLVFYVGLFPFYKYMTSYPIKYIYIQNKKSLLQRELERECFIFHYEANRCSLELQPRL